MSMLPWRASSSNVALPRAKLAANSVVWPRCRRLLPRLVLRCAMSFAHNASWRASHQPCLGSRPAPNRLSAISHRLKPRAGPMSPSRSIRCTSTSTKPIQSRRNSRVATEVVHQRLTQMKQQLQEIPRGTSAQDQALESGRRVVSAPGSPLAEAFKFFPAMVNLEMLLGTVVAAKSVLGTLRNKKARSKADRHLSALLETLNRTFKSKSRARVMAIEAPSPANKGLGALREPTTLEAKISSIVDKSAASVALEDPTQIPVTVNRPTLIESVTGLIRTREAKARQVEVKLKQNLDASEAVKHSLLELQKAKDARKPARAAEPVLAKLRELQTVSQELKKEKVARLKEFSSLQEELGSLSSSSTPTIQASETSSKPRNKKELVQVEAALGSSSLGSAKAFEVKLQELKALKAQVSAKLLGSHTAATPLEVKAKAERSAAQATSELDQCMGSMEQQLKEVGRRHQGSMLLAHAELRQRVTEAYQGKCTAARDVLQQHKAVQPQAQAGPASSASKNGKEASSRLKLSQLLLQGRKESSKGSAVPAGGPYLAVQSELQVAEESVKKYEGATKWLQHRILEVEKQGDSSRELEKLTSSLKFAQQRAEEEHSKVAELGARLAVLEADTNQQRTSLNDKLAKLKLHQKATAAAAASNSRRPSTAVPRTQSLSLFPGGYTPGTPRSASKAFSAAAASASATKWIQELTAKVKGKAGAAGASAGSLLSPLNSRELKTYAWAILPAYVPRDAKGTAELQGAESLVKDLMGKGASEAFAITIVQDLLPSLKLAKSTEPESSLLNV